MNRVHKLASPSHTTEDLINQIGADPAANAVAQAQVNADIDGPLASSSFEHDSVTRYETSSILQPPSRAR
jgi:hypothetical protein